MYYNRAREVHKWLNPPLLNPLLVKEGLAIYAFPLRNCNTLGSRLLNPPLLNPLCELPARQGALLLNPLLDKAHFVNSLLTMGGSRLLNPPLLNPPLLNPPLLNPLCELPTRLYIPQRGV